MLRGKDVEEIKEFRQQGLSIRAISRLTGYDRGTIARYLSKPKDRPTYGPRPAAASKLEKSNFLCFISGFTVAFSDPDV